MHLVELAKTFDTFLKVERNLSGRTRTAYQYDLDKFADWLRATTGHEPAVEKITIAQVKDYLAHLQQEKGYRATTLSRVISTLRVYFKFGVQQGVIPASPAESIYNPKLAKRLPIFLTQAELEKLLAPPDPADAMAVRDFAILVTLGFTGVRLQELVGLNMESIDHERGTMLVFGKGSKERLLPLNDTVIEAQKQWLLLRAPAEGERAVFLNRFGRRISGRAVEYIVNKWVRQTGVGKDKISPHKLRHTFATLLHLNDVELVEIKSLMGHASIMSTQIYTHTNADRLRSAVGRLGGVGASGGAVAGGATSADSPDARRAAAVKRVRSVEAMIEAESEGH